MFELLTLTGAIALVYAFMKSKSNAKSITIAAIIVMLFVDVILSRNETFSEWVVADGREFMVRPMLDLLLVFLLHIKPCRETAVIMMLALCSVVVNIIGFSFYLLGDPQYLLTDISLMAVFYAMLAVLLNKGLADGVYRGINKLSIINCYCVGHLKIPQRGVR